MLNTRVSTATANVQADAVGGLCDNGFLRVFAGVQPGGSNGVAAGAALATLRFATQAFRPAVAGVIASNPLNPDLATAGGGEPTWFRVFQADGATAVFDGSVGTANCNINVGASNLATLVIYPGGEFHLHSISYSVL